MYKLQIKSYILFIFIFILLYFETTPLGVVTASQLWKVFLFLYLLVVVLTHKVKVLPGFVKASYFRSIKFILNPGIYLNPLAEILDFSRYSLFPLLYHFLEIKKTKLFQIDKALIYSSIFFIVSFLPFVLGLLESRGSQLEYYEGFANLTGLFQGPHAASVTSTMSVLFILYFNKNYKFSRLARIFNLVVITFGIYIVFVTFVRTGYLMLILGVIIIYLPKKITPLTVIRLFLFICFLIFILYFLLENNQEFYNRIFDIRNGNQKEVGSGRLLFWITAFNLWLSGNIIEFLFGFGFEALTVAIEKVTGYKVFAHNEFLTQLAQNGIIGFCLLIWFVTSLFKFIFKRRKMFSYRISIAVFVVYISLMMTQGGFWFYPEFFLALILYKLDKEFQKSNEFIL